METKVKTQEELQKDVENLTEEVALLRSAVIGLIGEDPEGEYLPEFVEEVLRLSKEEPLYEFKDSESFLKLLEKDV
jgi:hypothetical protein